MNKFGNYTLLGIVLVSSFLRAQTPLITSFSPHSGPVGSTVTINGSNFNATTSNNIVFFGATKAAVQTATSTQLLVTVPVGASYAAVSVCVGGLTAYSSAPFNVTFAGGTTLSTASFRTRANIRTGLVPYGVAMHDLDGDGKSDLAVANNSGNTISVIRNLAVSGRIDSISFAAKVDFVTGVNPWGIAIGDLDGDGKPDIVVSNGTTGSISVFRNTGTPGSITPASFAAKVDFSTGGSGYGIAIGDLDGDGRPDIVTANRNAASISVLRNTSTTGTIDAGSFAIKVDFSTGAVPYGVTIGDVDGDGKPDVIVADNADHTISVFRNTSTSGSITSGSFASRITLVSSGTPIAVALGDLDGDGKPDLFSANNSDSSLSVLRNISTSGTITAGSFSNRVDFKLDGAPNSLALGDFNGDARVDIATANGGTSGSISILRNNSVSGTIDSNSFGARIVVKTGPSLYGSGIGDVDGDGKPDIVATLSGVDSVSVFRSDVGVPAAPQIIGAVSGNNRIVLKWNSILEPDFLLYRIYGGTTANPVNAIDSTTGGTNDTVKAVTGLTNGAKYYFRVTAVDSMGNESPYSNEIDATPGPGILSATSSVNFGNVVKGDSVTSTAKVYNNSANLLTISGANVLTGAYTVLTTTPILLNGNDSVSISIRFKPTSFGLFADSVILTSDGGRRSVPLSGTSPYPTISLNRTSIDLGYLAHGDSSKTDLVIRNNSINTLVVDSIYSGTKKIIPSMAGGNCKDSLKFTLLFRAEILGRFSDTIFIRHNAISATTKIPFSAIVYSKPGRPQSVSVSPNGWSNATTFRISWSQLQTNTLPVTRVWYSVDTIPRNAQQLKSISVTGANVDIPVAKVGRDTIYFFLEDSLGNKNPDSIGLVIAKFDNKKPSIVQNNNSLDTIFIQTNGTLSAIPPIIASGIEPANESGLRYLRLHYRRLDEQTWSTMNFSGLTNSSLTLPASSFVKSGTALGATYRIEATDSAGNSAFSNLLSFEIEYASAFTISRFSEIPTIASLNLPDNQAIKAYRMVSIPFELTDRKPGNLIEGSFGPHAKDGTPYANWRMVRLLNGSWNDFDSFKDSAVMNPGAGFFLIAKSAGKSVSVNKPKLVRADSMLYTGIKLSKGWNLLGNPFPVNVPYSELIFEGGKHLAHYYYSGTGTQGGWEGSGSNFDTLRSWEGWAVKMDSAAVLKINLTGIQPLATSVHGNRPVVESAQKNDLQGIGAWTLQFDARRDDIKLSCNGSEIGMSPAAIDGLDDADQFQAPVLGDRTIITGIRNENGLLMKDIRSLNKKGNIWNITVVTGDAFAQVSLNSSSTAALEKMNFAAIFVDSMKGLVYDLQKQKNITVTTGKGGVGNYRILVGTAEYIQKNLGGIVIIPDEPKLYANYPNPFNPETIIRYAVPEKMAGAHVVLKVYSALGQEVRTIVNGDSSPGFHEVLFDGHHLSSGVYYCSISIVGNGARYTETKKMLLLR